MTNKQWNYCALTPSRTDNGEMVAGRAFGVGPATDATEQYDSAFAMSEDFYSVLSVCVYEVGQECTRELADQEALQPKVPL